MIVTVSSEKVTAVLEERDGGREVGGTLDSS
jgi:hypothetical protein